MLSLIIIRDNIWLVTIIFTPHYQLRIKGLINGQITDITLNLLRGLFFRLFQMFQFVPLAATGGRQSFNCPSSHSWNIFTNSCGLSSFNSRQTSKYHVHHSKWLLQRLNPVLLLITGIFEVFWDGKNKLTIHYDLWILSLFCVMSNDE